jgi:hypothetical protein
MKAKVIIKAGICGFKTEALVASSDDQQVEFQISSDCEKITGLAQKMALAGPLDAYQEISSQGKSRILALAEEKLTGCCAACAVPIGLFKAMQVAAGLALPAEVCIQMEKEAGIPLSRHGSE